MPSFPFKRGLRNRIPHVTSDSAQKEELCRDSTSMLGWQPSKESISANVDAIKSFTSNAIITREGFRSISTGIIPDFEIPWPAATASSIQTSGADDT